MDSVTETMTPSSKEQNEPATKNEQDIFVMPATPSQVRFWWLHRVSQGNRALNMPLAWTSKGILDYGVAAKAMTELVRRHESLRTTFEVVDGKVTQIIHPPGEVALPVEDLETLSTTERQRKADLIVQQEARIEMDMEKGPLFFVRAIRMTPNENILLVTIHHSVCDGWSNGIVLRDFANIYDSLMRQAALSLPELPIQFGDFAVWLEEWRKGAEPAESLDYWRKALGGGFSPLRIRRDFSTDDGENRGEFETQLLTPEMVERARHFCAVQGVTLYMLLLSVYAAMLYRLTGQEDILIGTPCANRRTGTEDLIGPFSNPQVIRMRMTKGDDLRTVLERARDWTLGAVAHQDLPFEDLNEDEFFSRDENQLRMQVYFIYQRAFMQVQRTPSLEITPLRSVSPGTMFDLMLSIVERSEGPRLQLEYNPSFFRASTIQGILRLYVRILDSTISDLKMSVSNLPSLEGFDAAVNQTESKIKALDQIVSPNGHLASVDKGETAGKQSEGRVAPRDALELQVADIWATAMGLKNLSIRDSFFDLGGRSLSAMRIVSRINRMYPVDFGLATLFTGNTIERMAELIRNRLSANTSSSLVAMQPKGSAAPLFIIHGAGGNIVRFYQLAMLVGTDHPIYGIQAQSLLSGQPALLRMEDQAAYYLSEIRQIQPKGPYFFLGYSFGGTTALEIAHRLREMGEEVELLGMLDSRERDCMVVVHKSHSVTDRLSRRVARFFGNVSTLSVGETAAYLWDKFLTRTLRHTYSLAAALGIRQVPSFMKSTEDISWVSAMNYRPRPWPGRVTLFRASEQPDPNLPHDLGWTPLAEQGVEVYELPGDHDLVFREPNIQVLAQQLRARLEKSDESFRAKESTTKLHG
jgi:thioesterase domain-containing protein